MAKYEYKIVAGKEHQEPLIEVNKLGRQGWRVIHYSVEGDLAKAVLELASESAQ
jgi:hypothetical protein